MLFAAILTTIIGGVGFSQVVSDPKQVTLTWLRLGGLIAVALGAFTVTVLLSTRAEMAATFWICIGIAGAMFVCQLITVQLARRAAQRIFAGCAFAACSAAVAFICLSLAETAAIGAAEQAKPEATLSTMQTIGLWIAAPIATALSGGLVMTMMLGHAYLTAGGEMTQRPFLRLVRIMSAALLLRTIASVVFGTLVYWQRDAIDRSNYEIMMILARYAVGVIVPGVFMYMIDDCVRRRANQSATGILYVATFLVLMGEGFALHLIQQIGLGF